MIPLFLTSLFAQQVDYSQQVKNKPGLITDSLNTLVGNCNAATGKILAITQAWLIVPNTNLSGCQITFNGGSIQPANGATVTLNNFTANSNATIFDTHLGGTIVLNPGSTGEIYPQWFGANPNNVVSDSVTGPAFQAAINTAEASKIPLVVSGNYNINATALVASTGELTMLAGINGGTLTYNASTGWPLTLGNSSTLTNDYYINGITLSATVSGNGIRQLITRNVHLTNIHVNGVTTQGICHLIDGYANEAIFTTTINLWCDATFIGQQIQSTGGFDTVTSVYNYNFHVANNVTPTANSKGVYIVGGNPGGGSGSGIVYNGGFIGNLATGIYLEGASAVAAHNIIIDSLYCEGSNLDLFLDVGVFGVVFSNSNTCGGTGTTINSLVTDNSTVDTPTALAGVTGTVNANQFIGNRYINFSNGSIVLDITGRVNFYQPIIPPLNLGGVSGAASLGGVVNITRDSNALFGIIDKNTHSGGKTWIIGDGEGFGGAGNWGLYNQTDNLTYLSAGSGLLTLGSGTIIPKFNGTNSTGSTSFAPAGSNCPALSCTTPYKWIQIEFADGNVGYIPAWK